MKKRLEIFKKVVQEKTHFTADDFVWAVADIELAQEIKIFWAFLSRGCPHDGFLYFPKYVENFHNALKGCLDNLEREAVRAYNNKDIQELIWTDAGLRKKDTFRLEEYLQDSCAFVSDGKLKFFDSKEELYDYCCHLVRNNNSLYEGTLHINTDASSSVQVNIQSQDCTIRVSPKVKYFK